MLEGYRILSTTVRENIFLYIVLLFIIGVFYYVGTFVYKDCRKTKYSSGDTFGRLIGLAIIAIGIASTVGLCYGYTQKAFLDYKYVIVEDKNSKIKMDLKNVTSFTKDDNGTFTIITDKPL